MDQRQGQIYVFASCILLQRPCFGDLVRRHPKPQDRATGTRVSLSSLDSPLPYPFFSIQCYTTNPLPASFFSPNFNFTRRSKPKSHFLALALIPPSSLFPRPHNHPSPQIYPRSSENENEPTRNESTRYKLAKSKSKPNGTWNQGFEMAWVWGVFALLAPPRNLGDTHSIHLHLIYLHRRLLFLFRFVKQPNRFNSRKRREEEAKRNDSCSLTPS